MNVCMCVHHECMYVCASCMHACMRNRKLTRKMINQQISPNTEVIRQSQIATKLVSNTAH